MYCKTYCKAPQRGAAKNFFAEWLQKSDLQKFSAKKSGRLDEAKQIGIEIGQELIAKAGNSYKKK